MSLKCALCMKPAEDQTEYSGVATGDGRYVAVHRWCIADLSEKIRDRKPYESAEFPAECYVVEPGWRNTNRA